MPYVTKYKDVQAESITGYDPIPVHRPKFIYFEFPLVACIAGARNGQTNSDPCVWSCDWRWRPQRLLCTALIAPFDRRI